MTTPNFEVKVDANGRHISTLRPATTGTISVTGAAAGVSVPGVISEIEAKHTVVRIACDVDCHLAFSDNATQTDATTSDMLFLAGTENITLPEGTSYVSAIAASASGTCTVTRLT